MECYENIKVGEFNITIIQGSDTNDFDIMPTTDDDEPIILIGFTAAMHIRPSVNSNILYDELTTENSRIVIDDFDVEGVTFYKISIFFPSAVTSLYDFENAVYDLELYNNGSVDRLLQGVIIIDKEVTRQ